MMINIMYLVLTAMLALNVSAKIINAFFVIDKGIDGTNKVIDESNKFTENTLGLAASQDPEKYQPLVDAAKEVRTLASGFNQYVDDIRETLVSESGGYYPEDDAHHPGQPKGYKNKDVTTRMLVNGGKGEELKEKILGARQQILDIVNKLKGMEGTAINDETVATLESSITLGVSDDWQKEKKPTNWSHFTFNQMPLASVFPLLRKFQNDMKSSEAAVLNYLVNQVGAQSFKVDNFIPISSAKKSYIIAGDEYESEITVGASSKSVYENMKIAVNGNSLSVDENGIAKYSTRTSNTGVQKYKVAITLTNPSTGKTETYDKEFEYEVGRRSVTVSADKMNVFYIGVDNPVSVAAAGVSTNELRVSGSGGGIALKPSGTGKYIATVSRPGEDAVITVSGGGLTATKFDFRVKRIPDPVARLSKTSGGEMGSGEFKAQGGVVAILENFDFDARCDIQGYTLTYVPKREDPIDSVNPGGRYNDKSQRLVQRAKPGDIFYFDNVKARCPGDPAGRTINPMVFKIK